MKLIFTKTFALHSLLIFMAIVLLGMSPVFSYSKPPVTINGNIKDEKEMPLPGVSILVKGTKVGTVSDAGGNYKITLPEGSSVLVFSFAGFKRQEITVSGRTSVNVVMFEDVSKLNEVVITGYGSQSRETLTTSISKLDTRTLENVPYTNALSALQGSIPGVRVQSVTGQPGQPPRVVLRGGVSINQSASITANSPLYLVDGVIRPNLADIAADDIESLQVLKDAASTSIYGARASNGVVLVTTKSGKSGITKISYSYDLTSANESGRAMEYVSAADYVYYGRQGNIWAMPKVGVAAITTRLASSAGWGTGNDLTKNTAFTTQYLTSANAYKLNEGWQSIQDPLDPTKTIIFDETDFQKLRMQTALSHNHFISASGGTEKAKFNAGIGYLMAEGTALSSDYNRLSANFNGSLQVNKKIRVDGRMLFSSTDFLLLTPETIANQTLTSTGGALSNVFYRSSSLPSTTKYKFEDGTIAPGVNSSLGNPDYYQKGPFSPQRKNTGEKLSVSLTGKWDILPGLSFDPLLSYYKDEQYGRSFQPAFLAGITSFNVSRATYQYQDNTTNLQADAVLTYVKSLSKHNFEAKAGYSYFKRNLWGILAQGTNAATDNVLTVNNFGTPGTPGGSENILVTEGVFGRLNYDYDQKYLVSVTGRYDGASNLGADNQFAFFPGVGLGWNIHKEDFWQSVPKQISSLKLRATYGENGKIDQLSDYGWQGTFGVGSIYNGAAAVTTADLPNLDLQWEHSKTFDIGVDLGMFNNRATLIFDYFDKKTDNLIALIQLPTSSGYSTVRSNNGSLGNKGIEADLNVRVFNDQKAFQWTMNINASKVSSKVLKLPNNGVLGNRQGGIEVWDPAVGAYVWKAGTTAGSTGAVPTSFIEGGRIGDMYAYKQVGIYATDAEAALAPYDTGATVDFGSATARTKYGGDVNWADIDGNNIIDPRDQVYVGNFYPTWTGGFSNYFSYKGFSLAIRTDFATGHTIYNYAKVFADGQQQGDAMPTKDFIEKSWKKQGDITNTPRYVHQINVNISRNSTYYEKGDFLALREVTLGYNLPASLLKKIRMSSVRFNLTGNNLHYFTKYSGQSPEEGGVDNGHYPIPRGFTLGTNISF
jgi:TonB-linked SusC/RagA family outer membrane protein